MKVWACVSTPVCQQQLHTICVESVNNNCTPHAQVISGALQSGNEDVVVLAFQVCVCEAGR